MPELNYLAVVVAAVAAYILGALWYSPFLFANAWLAENGRTMASLRAERSSMWLRYGIAAVTALISAYAMAALLITPQHHSLVIGLKRGFAAGTCWVAMSLASSYAFELKSARHWAINGGYFVVQFTVMGAVLGVMNA